MKRVLVIDDSREFTDLVARHLRRRGYEVASALSGDAGLKLCAQAAPALVLLDLNLGDMPGLEVLRQLRTSAPETQVAIVTGHPELSSALAAIKGQVVDYLCKPFELAELDALLTHALGDGSTRAAAEPEPTSHAPEIVGTSRSTSELRTLLTRLAGTGVRAALITGESGTGKDLAARFFHAHSARRTGPFIEVNCAAVGENLFESEFFGHERGAFTGAVSTNRGLVELAVGGTLFLDEVAEIPLSCQPKLLRFLEDQSFLRVGGKKKMSTDVQIVAATNRDLRAMVEQWAFRQDLYFRLAVVPVTLAPLRERPEDIVPLAEYWLAEANARYGKSVRGFSAGAGARLTAAPWPGNVRELRNLVERLVILCLGDEIDEAQFPPEYARATPAESAAAPVAPLTLEEAEQAHMLRVLAQVNGNKTKAAEILGISRQTLRTRLGK